MTIQEIVDREYDERMRQPLPVITQGNTDKLSMLIDKEEVKVTNEKS